MWAWYIKLKFDTSCILDQIQKHAYYEHFVSLTWLEIFLILC